MKNSDNDLNITHNIKTIDWLKTEILAYVSLLFKKMSFSKNDDNSNVIADILANIISACYLLSKRLGLGYGVIDAKIQANLRNAFLEGNDLEEKYGDLSELSRHLRAGRDKVER